MGSWFALGLVFFATGTANVKCLQPEVLYQMVSLPSVFQETRSVDEDVIVLRNGDEVRGQVLNETLEMSTPYGKVILPLRRCAGVSLQGVSTNAETLISVNYNRFAGILQDRTIRLRQKSSGAEREIRKQRIQSLIFKKGDDEVAFVDPKTRASLFIMTNGDRLTGKPADPTLMVETGSLGTAVSFADTRRIEIVSGTQEEVLIEMANGDQLEGALATEEITLDLDLGVRIEAIYRDQFAEILVGDGNAQAAVDLGIVLPQDGEASETQYSETAAEVVTNSIGMEFRLIRPGSFMMGSENGEDNESPVHRVTLTKSFYIGTREVTQSQWGEVMGTDIHEQRDKADSQYTVCGEGPDHPMYHVSWLEAKEFCHRLKEREGVEYRLPTEAEWEYSCRAGSRTKFYWGDRVNERFFWYEENSKRLTQPVGTRLPNIWGLYDMSGNVWEWCEDRYAPAYPSEPQLDPLGPDEGALQVIRGGYCSLSPRYCRSARRDGFHQAGRSRSVGFRLARDL